MSVPPHESCVNIYTMKSLYQLTEHAWALSGSNLTNTIYRTAPVGAGKKG